MQLDLATVLVLHPLSLIMGSACFIYAMLHSRHQRGLGKMATGFVFLAIGSVLAALGERDAIPYEFWTLASLTLGPLAYSLFWIGLRDLVYEKHIPGSAWILLVPLALFVAAILTDFHLVNLQRATVFLVVMAAFALQAAWLVLSDPLGENLSGRFALSCVLGMKALVACATLASIAFPGVTGMTPAIMFCILILCQFGIAMFVLIFVQERIESRLVKLTETDTLTGIHNRHWLYDHVSAMAPHGDAYIAIDIDFFKRVNDWHGHAAGDQVLIAVAQRMASIVGPSALLARMGGEEFGLYLPARSAHPAAVIAEALRSAVDDLRIEYQGNQIPVTISAGLAFSEGGMEITSLMALADKALYAAKRDGRNRVVIYSKQMDHEETEQSQVVPAIMQCEA